MENSKKVIFNSSLISENLNVLALLRNYPDLRLRMDLKISQISFGGIWWDDFQALKKCVISDFNYKLRCLNSLFINS